MPTITPAPEMLLATALAAALTDAGFPATAYRYRWPTKQQLATPTISVVPTAATTEPADRENNQTTATIEIAVQQTIGAQTATALETPAAYADSVAALWEKDGPLRPIRFQIGDRAATWESLERSPTVRPDHLARLNLFTAQIRVTFSLD